AGGRDIPHAMSAPDRGSRTTAATLVPVGDRAASAIYGTILVTAVIVALSEDPSATASQLMEAVATTSVVFWLAHVYANFIGHRAELPDSGRSEGIRVALVRDLPMIQAAVPPLVALLLGAVGPLSRNHAITVALVVGVIELFVWGFLAGRGPGSTFIRS